VSASPIRVLIVDDQALMREGLKTLLEGDEKVEIAGEAADGVEALRKIRHAKPDVALVDVRMPRMDGVELAGRLSAHHPEVAVIILTTFDDDEYIFGGIRAGARGYLLKDTPSEELVSAIEKTHRGETVLGGQVTSRVVSELKRLSGPAGASAGVLSEREVEVVRLVGSGASNRELARALYISEGTAKNHISKILRKLDLRDRTQLALYAAERGWTEKASLTQIKRIHQDPSDSGQRK
jgi:DNA-binding NarL/FixJ family response regulator